MADLIKIKNLRVRACRPGSAVQSGKLPGSAVQSGQLSGSAAQSGRLSGSAGQTAQASGSALPAVSDYELAVDAVLCTDTRAAGLSDEMQKSVDYAAVCRLIEEYMRKHDFRLMESYAEHLAEEILMEIPQADRVDLEIRKAGIYADVDAESVSVEISRAWHTVDLSLGSNVGDRQACVMNAVRSMEGNPHNRRVKRSGVIEARAYPSSDEPSYLNAAVEMQTLYTPKELLGYLLGLERDAESEKKENRGLCALDIDIIFYDDCVMGDNDIVIPHPDMQNRMFVLGPLSELCPGKLHPVFNKSVMRMRRELEHRQEKEKEESRGTGTGAKTSSVTASGTGSGTGSGTAGGTKGRTGSGTARGTGGRSGSTKGNGGK